MYAHKNQKDVGKLKEQQKKKKTRREILLPRDSYQYPGTEPHSHASCTDKWRAFSPHLKKMKSTATFVFNHTKVPRLLNQSLDKI